jgi:hypothetical protein
MANSPKILLTPPNLINYTENPSFRSVISAPVFCLDYNISMRFFLIQIYLLIKIMIMIPWQVKKKRKKKRPTFISIFFLLVWVSGSACAHLD